MFFHNLNPVLFSFGHFQIRYYGLAWVLGVLIIYYFLNKNRDRLEISKEKVDDYLLYLIFGVFIGARLIHVLFSDFSFYSDNLLRIFYFWEGGIAFHGGLLGGILSTYYFVKKNSISLWKLADVIALPLALVLGIGRLANFINGELYGVVTDVSWCVNFPLIDGCRHPTQIYESLSNFFIFGVLFYFSKREHKRGFIFWLFIVLIGIFRFLISFIRVDDKFLGLSDGQYFSLIMILIGGYVLFKHYRKNEM
tara:strand:- start:382 stop:1134 length:753 start_codon:yes stop_codon:yes gene_type:complete